MPKMIGITEEIWWQVIGCEKSEISYENFQQSKPRKAYVVKSRTAAPKMPLWHQETLSLLFFRSRKIAENEEIGLLRRTFTFMREISICKGASLSVLGRRRRRRTQTWGNSPKEKSRN